MMVTPVTRGGKTKKTLREKRYANDCNRVDSPFPLSQVTYGWTVFANVKERVSNDQLAPNYHQIHQ